MMDAGEKRSLRRGDTVANVAKPDAERAGSQERRGTTPDSRRAASLLVVCPAFNESESVAAVVAELRSAVPHADVLVVDDGSTDATALVAERAGARILQLSFNVGVGGALRAGLLLGHREGYAAIVQCDADGQHRASEIPALVDALSSADIVIGERWTTAGYVVRGPRRWAMRLLAGVFSRVHGTRLTDVTSGFRAFGPAAVEVLSRELPPEYLGDTIEALVIARAYSLRVVQVPVQMRERLAGAPSHRPVRAALYLARSVTVLFLSMLRLVGRRRRLPGMPA
jgi:glycosyltransferase involved in cell wall biosynthesis